jgi:hypothetical protein
MRTDKKKGIDTPEVSETSFLDVMVAIECGLPNQFNSFFNNPNDPNVGVLI